MLYLLSWCCLQTAGTYNPDSSLLVVTYYDLIIFSVILQENPYGGAEAHANGLTHGEHICSHHSVVHLACLSSICIVCFSHEYQVDCMQTGLSAS